MAIWWRSAAVGMLHGNAGCSDMRHGLWVGIDGLRTTEKWRLHGQKSPKLGVRIYHVDSSGTLTIFTPTSTPCSKFRRNVKKQI